jgi:hypothetical protein
MANIPQSILTKKQVKTLPAKLFEEDGQKYMIKVKLRFDDDCGNGHNSFGITGDITRLNNNGNWVDDCGGCIHEEIVKHYPKLAPYIKWHLCSTDEPMHYVANTVYHASNRDYNGLLEGEKRQIIAGKTGLPAWHIMAIHKETGEEKPLYELEKNIDALEAPACEYTLEYRPWCTIGKGKTRDFDAARRSAIWPEATDEQLSLPADQLAELLKARLPALMQSFKTAMESLGFTY